MLFSLFIGEFALLIDRISSGEMKDIISLLPDKIKQLALTQ